MLDYLVDLVTRLGHWGYLVIFIGAGLESAAFLGLFVPGESLVLVCGFLAAQGALDLDAAIVTISVGATLGDSIGYELGRRLGRPWLDRYGRRVGLNKERVGRADAFFERHGGKAVFLGRFVGFARALAPFLAGASRLAYRRFLPYNALGAILWSSAIILLGYFLGASWKVAGRWIGEASAILGGFLLFALVLGWLWRWAVRHEADIKRWGNGVLARPRVVALRRRYAPLIAFAQARLSRQGYLGLHLTVGAVVLFAASWLFGGIVEDLLTGDPLTIVDTHVAAWFAAHREPAVTALMLMISRIHGTIGISLLSIAVAIYLALKREWYWIFGLVLIVPGTAVLNFYMKDVFDRARPGGPDPITDLLTYSFPSGHVASATAFYAFVAALIMASSKAWTWRVLAPLGALLLITIVALSRIYLGVHYLSDTLAGFAEAIAWVAICLTAIATLRRARQATPP